ncbi:hypothetical protein B0T13DRAFT_486818 [Neurospora crassa]|nr:hypothetical protein B0T13DRAFT_486818 [Neurospora crassa]
MGYPSTFVQPVQRNDSDKRLTQVALLICIAIEELWDRLPGEFIVANLYSPSKSVCVIARRCGRRVHLVCTLLPFARILKPVRGGEQWISGESLRGIVTCCGRHVHVAAFGADLEAREKARRGYLRSGSPTTPTAASGGWQCCVFLLSTSTPRVGGGLVPDDRWSRAGVVQGTNEEKWATATVEPWTMCLKLNWNWKK